MNSQFRIGFRFNIFFYVFESLVIIALYIFYRRMPPASFVVFCTFALASTVFFIRGVKSGKLKRVQYQRLQSIAHIALHMILSVAFDSAQVFLFAMALSAIVVFIFIDSSITKFHAAVSIPIVVIAAIGIGLVNGTRQTMLVYSFGSLVVLMINFVIVSMCSIINFQGRKSKEQERSLDDLLKVVEAKCDEAQDATRSKTRFLANMSHEIRTPINAIMGMNEMILRESDDEEIRGYASEAGAAADSLLEIVNDILDITKIEQGKFSDISAEYNVKTLILDIYNLVKYRAEAKNLKFEVNCDPSLPTVLFGDDIHLKQILSNLLSNAVKYTREGTVSLNVNYLGKGKVFFSVKDTGIGIKQEDLARLFDAFERFDIYRNKSIEGTGLGLNITSQLLKKFGSSLNVKSYYGIGSEFSFTLEQEIVDETPVGHIDIAERVDNKSAYTSGITAPDANVLVVDDNAMNRKVFINLLKNTKINIDAAESGEECLRLIEKKHYDIIFMDHMMPHMDGIETFEIMKSKEHNLCKDTPVIILTANAIVGAKERYEKCGFDGYLTKPVSAETLENTIFGMLDKSLIVSSEENGGSEETEAVELPIIEGVNWELAKINVGEDLIPESVDMFVKAMKSDADELCGYYADIDDESALLSYRVKVHSMKSSATLIGIIRLAGMAMELESAARGGKTDIIRALHPIFIESWLGYYEPLSAMVGTQTATRNASDYPEDIADIIAEIKEAAGRLDVGALDDLSAELGDYIFEEEQAQKIEQLKAMIFAFEIEKIKAFEL